MEQFKFAVLIIHRGDRPLFLQHFHRQLSKQTVQPTILEIIDYPPVDDKVDITIRYRKGYDNLRGKGLDCIVIMEVDDAYLPTYLETMLRGWVDHGCPDIFGPKYTTYVNLRLGEGVVRKAITLKHEQRSSMMSTLIKADLDLNWPADSYPYTDSHLWIHCKNKKTFAPDRIICLGIKGGYVNGLTGGQFHRDKLKMYDESVNLLKIVGEENFKFYSENFPLLKTKKVGREIVFVE